jgi:T5SS/PEP-CTERM-associated repeat protein
VTIFFVTGVHKMLGRFPLLALLMGGALGTDLANAQFTSDHQTNVVSSTTVNWAGNYFIGSNTVANALLIRSAGVLTNADAYVGYLPTSSNNYVLVSGANSVWSNANMYLGYSGVGNALVISNAGRVENSQAFYIANDGTSSSNRVLVTGTNSLLDTPSSALFVGYSGAGNSLVISNGGRVANSTAYVGDGTSSSGNNVLVTGPGSVWNNYSTVMIGDQGNNNKLTITKGGRVVSAYATIGLWGTATSNSVVVSDSGSLWDDSAVASDINFGMMSSGNSLIVTIGGQVLGYYSYFGRSGGAYNSALVTGTGSSFSVNCYIYTGKQGHDNSFTAANGATVSDKFCYISYDAGSSNNSVLLTGTNTSWQNSYSVFVGFDGGAGSLTISNGATMNTGGAFGVSHDGALGVDSTSSNNRALVTGGGSVLNCADNVYVGLNGPANTLVISNGGRVINTDGMVGANPGSDGNSARVVGAGSVWTNSSDMYIGDFGAGNSLVVSDGGRIINGNGFLGRTSGSDSNCVLVAGSGSVWTNSSYVYVGCFGAANSLVVSNGASVSDDTGLIGYDTNSINNQALIAGPGSVWSNPTALYVGDFGAGNTLTIRDGAKVVDGWGLVGEEDSSSNNTVYVESGGVWSNQQLAIGDLGSHNALFVNGGTVSAGYMAVGYGSFFCDNLAELDSGTIVVTNATHDAVLEVYAGSFLLTGGTLLVDTLLVTNPCAQFMHIGGTLAYRNLILNPDADADGDGIPNGWEQAYGLDPLNPLDAAADPDGDGMSNLQEYLAGTNPTNSASCLRITSAEKTGKDVRVSWKAVGGKRYVVQTSTALTNGFADLSPAITVPGTAETATNYLHAGAITNWPGCYYRVRLAP